jgi:phenylalanyl-tRNA synthetase beta subunit
MVNYRYTVTIDDYECDCYSVKEVVEAINERSRCAVVTTDMINTLFTRPEKANKRLFRTVHDDNLNKIFVDRRPLPTKAQLAQAELDKINAIVQQMNVAA